MVEKRTLEVELRLPTPLVERLTRIGGTATQAGLIAAALSLVSESSASDEDPDLDRRSWLALLLQQSLHDEIALFMLGHENLSAVVAEYIEGVEPVFERLALERGKDGEPVETSVIPERWPYVPQEATAIDPKLIAAAGMELHAAMLNVVAFLMGKDPKSSSTAGKTLDMMADAVERYERAVYPVAAAQDLPQELPQELPIEVPRETSEPVEPTSTPDEPELGEA